MKRRIIVELEISRSEPARTLMILTDLCDFLEKYRETAIIEDYGIGLEIPQYEIKALPTKKETPRDIGHGAAEEIHGSTD